MVQEHLIKKSKMPSINISHGTVELKLTSPRSKVRICDNNGNQIPRPAKEGKYDDNNFIEWMITNDQVKKLTHSFLNKKEIIKTISQINKIEKFLKESSHFKRKSKRPNKVKNKWGNFEIYKCNEIFYSFEKKVNSDIKLKIAPKMGDYTLAPHLFVLFSFKSKKIVFSNNNGLIRKSDLLGSGAKARWNQNKKVIIEIAKALSHSSENHKNDVIRLLTELI